MFVEIDLGDHAEEVKKPSHNKAKLSTGNALAQDPQGFSGELAPCMSVLQGEAETGPMASRKPQGVGD